MSVSALWTSLMRDDKIKVQADKEKEWARENYTILKADEQRKEQ